MDLVHYSDFENIYAVDVFEDEFRSLFKKDKGNLVRYLDWLDTKLHILNDEGVNAVDGITFKKLQGYNDLYEIRHTKSTANPRVIYCYFEGNTTILLASTKEKNASDISHKADVALGRLKLIMEE